MFTEDDSLILHWYPEWQSNGSWYKNPELRHPSQYTALGCGKWQLPKEQDKSTSVTFKNFRFHIYVLIYDICFCLSDFTLYDRPYVHPYHYTWLSFFPFDKWYWWTYLQGRNRRTMIRHVQTTRQLHSLPMLVRLCSKSFKLHFSSTWIKNFQMYKLDLENTEEPWIKLSVFVGS